MPAVTPSKATLEYMRDCLKAAFASARERSKSYPDNDSYLSRGSFEANFFHGWMSGKLESIETQLRLMSRTTKRTTRR